MPPKTALTLRALMDLRKINSTQLAMKIGNSQPHISRWLNSHDHPSPARAVKIGEALEAWPEIESDGVIVWRPN